VIANRARIYCDFNDSIDSLRVRHTHDAAGSTSRITTSTGMITGDTLTLTLAGDDDPNGVGIVALTTCSLPSTAGRGSRSSTARLRGGHVKRSLPCPSA